MNRIIRIFKSLIINNLKFLLIKLFHYGCFSFNFINFIDPSCVFDFKNNGKIIIGKKVNIPYKSIIGVRNAGEIIIGDRSFINNNCQIIAHRSISIGNDVCIGPNTIIMDHDHCYGACGVEKKKFNSKDIIIEDGAWIGANCVILKGSVIRKNSVIGAGSIVNCEVPENTLFVQKKDNCFIKFKG